MANNTIVLCYINGEIIDCEFGVCYNRPPEKGVSINNMITFDELESKLGYALNIDRIHTKLNMIFRYLVPFPNGNGHVNYVSLPIRDDGDVSIMLNVVTQSPPPNTIEIYCQTSSRDRGDIPSGFTTLVHIEAIDPSQQRVEEDTSSLMGFQSYDNEMELVIGVELIGMTEPIMMTSTIFAEILPSHDDDNVELFDEDDANEDIMNMKDNENNEIGENHVSLFGSEHDVPPPLFGQLNWDVTNFMTDHELTTRTGLWNEMDELFKGLRFESNEDLQYAVKHYSINRNQHLIVVELEPNM